MNTSTADTLNAVSSFIAERDWDQFQTPENLAKSISIEAGELLECFQWNNNYDYQEVKYELADILTYCYTLCSKLNLSPNDIILEKLTISAKKYPIEKSKGRSTKYTKL